MPMNESKLFGKRIRTVRKAAKISQEKAAEAAHLNPKYLGEIERGEKRPSFEAIVALANALNVSPAVLFEFEREDLDDRALRRAIENLAKRATYEQLQQIHRLIRAFLEL
jgi:transcriptional regulator with XRE-family HTH domain